MTGIDDRTILITGASQGLGRALAVAYAPRASAVYLLARKEAGLNETARLVAAGGGTAHVLVADMASVESLGGAVGLIRASGARIDVLIHNAADVTSKPFRETSLEEIDRLIATNITGILQLTSLLCEDLLASQGVIVHLASLAGYKPNPAQTVYSVTKRALGGISDALRAEFAPQGVKVVHVALPTIALVEGAPGIPVAHVAERIARAIGEGTREVFFSPVTRALMRVYGAFPGLMGLR